MKDILPVYGEVIGMSDEAGVNDSCTQKVECIHKGYCEDMLLVGEHVGRVIEKRMERAYEYQMINAILNSTSQC